jgi:GTP pyrophosphokinase
MHSLTHLERYAVKDRARIQQALEFATAQHAPQRRVGGEPFITHPVAVTQLLIDEFSADAETVMAGLLHDTVEDTGATLEQVEGMFGPAVRFLVDGTTDVGKGDGNGHIEDRAERDAASHKKVEAYAAKDQRVYLIKIADRWHNVQHMSALRPKNQRRLANEALSFHIPVCRRLGFTKQADAFQHACEDALRRLDALEKRKSNYRRYLR